MTRRRDHRLRRVVQLSLALSATVVFATATSTSAHVNSALAPTTVPSACGSSTPPTTTTSTTTSTTSTTVVTTTTVPATTTTSPTTTTVPTSTTTTTVPKRMVFAWPAHDSAAFAIPLLCVAASSTYQPRVPIASLTKMMTAWVVLHQLPLSIHGQGPCLVVDASDVAQYDYDVSSGQSNARIVLGERICEVTLLRGLLVHSAGDYSELLLKMIGWTPATFVRVMNADARALGLARTHYVDLTGISPGDQSTAGAQATMAVDLMSHEPIVDHIVILTHVALPYNGVVISYTPLVGTANVVGVKSGYTDPAGGCDVMAVRVTIGATSFLSYAVVLGQHGGNAINVAGELALALEHSLRPAIKQVRTTTGVQLVWTGPVADVRPVAT